MLPDLPPQGSLRCQIPRCPLPPGRYVINLYIDAGGEMLDWIQRASELTIVEGDFYGTGRPGHVPSHQAILIDHDWTIDTSVLQPSEPAAKAR